MVPTSTGAEYILAFMLADARHWQTRTCTHWKRTKRNRTRDLIHAILYKITGGDVRNTARREEEKHERGENEERNETRRERNKKKRGRNALSLGGKEWKKGRDVWTRKKAVCECGSNRKATHRDAALPSTEPRGLDCRAVPPRKPTNRSSIHPPPHPSTTSSPSPAVPVSLPLSPPVMPLLHPSGPQRSPTSPPLPFSLRLLTTPHSPPLNRYTLVLFLLPFSWTISGSILGFAHFFPFGFPLSLSLSYL